MGANDSVVQVRLKWAKLWFSVGEVKTSEEGRPAGFRFHFLPSYWKYGFSDLAVIILVVTLEDSL